MSLEILSCARARVGGLVEQNAMVGAQEVSNKPPPQQVCDITGVADVHLLMVL
jgi:hypothetical protein